MTEQNSSPTRAQTPPSATRPAFHMRGFTSLLLFLAFLAAAVAGVMLYFTPRGRVANWTGWTLFGLEKDQWAAVHIIASLVLVVSAAVHLYYNWTVFWCYIKKRFEAGLNLKREMALAFLVMAVCVAGAIYAWPPFSYIIEAQIAVRDYWEREAAAAPAPHADEFTLERLAGQSGVPLDTILERLEAAGITGASPGATLSELAEQHGQTPDGLFAIAAPDFRGYGRGGMGRGGGGMGRGGGRGYGGGRGDRGGRGEY